MCRDIWPIDKRAARKPEGWSGWPDNKQFALILNHDVDTQAGHDNCYNLMNLEKDLGFQSTFYFVPERYTISKKLIKDLKENGFEVGVHGLKHDGKLFLKKEIFQERAIKINRYLKEWDTKGFTSPSTLRNFNWMHELNIEYATTSFDTDPFEPQPDGVCTIFPFIVEYNKKKYIELPYTLSQDFSLYILMKEKNIDLWKEKLDWIAEKGGMALINIHPDYLNFDSNHGSEKYPLEYYLEFLRYLFGKYSGQYWQPLAPEMAHFWKNHMSNHNHLL